MFSGPVSGLWTSPNPWSSVPQGSLKIAEDVIFVAPSVMEPRRGFSEGATFGTGDSLADAMAFYGGNLLLAYDFTRVAIKPSNNEQFFVWAETFEPNGANRLRFEAAARCIYFNPADGIRVFDGEEDFFTANVTDAMLRVLAWAPSTQDP